MRPNITNNPSAEDRDIIIQAGGDSFQLSIFFVNESGLFRVQSSSFRQLEFRDNIFNPFVSFSLILRNNNNEIEAGLHSSEENLNAASQFEFKGNGDEFVLITFKPVGDTDTTIKSREMFPYKLELPCFIKDEKEFEENGNQFKVYELMDVKYRELTYPTKSWSTASLVEGNVTQLSDDERAVYTGDAIKNVIETFVSDKVINADRWDKGSSKTFYSAPMGTTPMEIIEYLLENHTSSISNVPALLREDKFGNLNLLGIDKIFEGIGNNHIGPDVVGSYELPVDTFNETNTFAAPTYKEKTPFKNNNPITSYHFLNFSSTSALERLRSADVVKYDFGSKKFSVFRKEGNIENTINVFNKFLTNIPGANAKVNYKPSDKILNKNIFSSHYTTTGSDTVAELEGRNELLKDLLFLSNNLEFSSTGNINLRSGKFVNVVRDTNIDSEFEKKLQGYYFILDTQHIINSTEYTTSVITTKPYSV